MATAMEIADMTCCETVAPSRPLNEARSQDFPANGRHMKRSFETVIGIKGPPDQVFAWLDDQTRLAAHVEQPSAMTGGGRMTYEFDAERGQAVGSHIKMGGSAFGLSLAVDEVVAEREPPRRKVWRTVGATRLIVVGNYEMGFELQPDAKGSTLRVWIHYDLAPSIIGQVFGPVLAPLYARWCVGRMVGDAAEHFSRPDGRTEPVRPQVF